MMPSGTDQWVPRDFFSPYQFDYHYASCGEMFGEPMIGKRVHDILCAVELLASKGAEVVIAAEGISGVPALMAAVLSDKVTQLSLSGLIPSYESMLADPGSKYPLSCMASGILKVMDLPDLLDAVRSKLTLQ